MEEVAIIMQGPTPVPLVFGKGFLVALLRKQGVIEEGRLAAIPRVKVEMRSVRPDPDRVALFRKVCGFPAGELPTPFPETMFLTMMARIFTSGHFPLSPLGLIHTSQTISRHASIDPSAALDLTCRLSSVERIERGIESTCTMEVRSEGSLAWEGRATFLSRSRQTRKGGTRSEKAHPEVPMPRTTIEVPENTGRLFGRASADYSPHHMTRLTARVLGFRRPIAHGMWTLSRALAEIEREHSLGAYSVEASFKRPILMPARIALSYGEPSRKTDFAVHDAAKGTPHLVGTIRT